jgi:Golgi phosphoprotein 3
MLPQNRELRLHEEILLIALREEDGKIDGKASFEYRTIMAAAILAELLLLKKLSISIDKSPKISVLDHLPVKNSVLDAALGQISKSKKERTAASWVQKLSSLKGLYEETAENLCDKSILKAQEGTVFFFFDKTYYPELDPRPEQQLIKRLENAIFTDANDIDERTLVLLALLHKSEMLHIPFDKKKIKERKERMESICSGNAAGEAARSVIEAAQVALIVTTVIVPSVTVSVV